MFSTCLSVRPQPTKLVNTYILKMSGPILSATWHKSSTGKGHATINFWGQRGRHTTTPKLDLETI